MQWEYRVLRVPGQTTTPENIEKWLDEHGAHGWELIHTNGFGLYYFKRELFK